MGGGPDKEELLITLPLPPAVFPDLKAKYPDINIHYVQLSSDKEAKDEPKHSELKPLYQKATLLIALNVLPQDPDDIPNVKFIHLASAGVDHLSKSPIFSSSTFPFASIGGFTAMSVASRAVSLRTSSKIPITTSSGIHGPPITEWVLASVLGLTRQSFTFHKWQEQRHWGKPQEIPGGGMSGIHDWHGCTIGVAGYGGIGRHIARVFNALGSSVHVYTASPRSTPESRRDTGYSLPNAGDPTGSIPAAWFSGTTPESLHTFLRSGLDLLIIALPLTPKTEGLFGAPELRALHQGWAAKANQSPSDGASSGNGPILVNIARGKILDQVALREALEDGTLAGAAVDVTEPEPLPEDDPLWGTRNLVLTPHVSGLGKEYFARSIGVWAENVARLERGEELVNEVKRERGY